MAIPLALRKQINMANVDWMKVRINAITVEAEGIKSFEFVDPNGADLPAFEAGAHLDIVAPGDFPRQYSLSNDPSETHRYVVSILREEAGRGGSKAMHDQLSEGDLVDITVPTNHFPLSEDADHHLLIAGGIGITPMLAMARFLSRTGQNWTLHYATRTAENMAFKDLLSNAPYGDHVSFYHDGGDPSKGINLKALLGEHQDGTHVYCCGPTGLMLAVQAATEHWPAGTAHFEFFSADGLDTGPREDDESFEIEIASTGDVHKVGKDETILDVLNKNGQNIPFMCSEGICGTCIVDVLEGEPDHRDMVLDDDEKESNELITVCCSRSKSKRLKLDL